MKLTVYLSGEIHTSWRDDVTLACEKQCLDITFLGPVTDHGASDDCGVEIMGPEPDKFWHDHKGAKLNAIRTRTAISQSDVVVVRFGDKYKQWNAAFDAGYAAALGKALVIMHGSDHQHAMKEVDGAALAVVETADQVAAILTYVTTGKI
jgi:YtoQ family protein